MSLSPMSHVEIIRKCHVALSILGVKGHILGKAALWYDINIRDWSLMTGRGWLQKGVGAEKIFSHTEGGEGGTTSFGVVFMQ